MIAALILVMSVVALAQFAIAQWRSMWMTVAAQPLSDYVQAATGISDAAISGNDFDLLVRTSEQLSPSTQERNLWLREVGVYYRVIRALDGICAKQISGVSGWAKSELVACSRYAAAVLDQRLNSSFACASEVRNY
ncbi:MAG: hypothetical protein ACHP79_15595 [Terriglobales bacterium]